MSCSFAALLQHLILWKASDVHECVPILLRLWFSPGSLGAGGTATGTLPRGHRLHDWRRQLPGARIAPLCMAADHTLFRVPALMSLDTAAVLCVLV